MDVLLEEPPEDPGDWTEEQWREWLTQAPPDPDTGRAHPLSRATSSSGGVALGAAMLGLQQAIYGDRPKVEIVAEVDADGLDLGHIELDDEDPGLSRVQLDHPGGTSPTF
ncbi:MAG: hypothetical protein Q8K58_14075 [Acidimicrobiales bacterium]|nr:hypothetical protein [Acidimicrobiales bacterium]